MRNQLIRITNCILTRINSYYVKKTIIFFLDRNHERNDIMSAKYISKAQNNQEKWKRGILHTASVRIKVQNLHPV